MNTYLIVPVGELVKVDFELVSQTSAATCRRSVDRTLALIRWSGEAPPFVALLDGAVGPFSAIGIAAQLESPAWAFPPPPRPSITL